MPELPEVERVKQSLERFVVGAVVQRVQLRRRDIVHQVADVRHARRRITSRALLEGCRIKGVVRHGKNLAFITHEGPALAVHLGMSGQLLFLPNRQRPRQPNHIHCIWRLQKTSARSAARGAEGRLLFRDPRRFGGLWVFESFESLCARRFASLGPDALTINARQLVNALREARRPIKAALLDQSVLAGVGNIYADEALFKAGLHPASVAANVPARAIEELAKAIRQVLKASIRFGGTSIRDYRDAADESGRFAERLVVYGCGGEACRRCGETLRCSTVAQRTTVFCRRCQRRY